MTQAPKYKEATKRSALYRVAQVFSITSILAIVLMTFASIILWDAPHHHARVRVEQIKHAWFGDWVTDEDLKPKKGKTPATEQLANALSEAKDISFFQNEKWFGTHVILLITTGTTFATANDLIDGKVKNQWCYTTFDNGGISTKIDLGSKTGLSAPDFADLKNITNAGLTQLGVDASGLSNIARTHCRFGNGLKNVISRENS
ncbi:hypothetical protein [Maritalea sp.]|uniref:hypothetical protein n=1 Tax=Maritalea sp. TaxID=2003361 RepID=UPI003EF40869